MAKYTVFGVERNIDVPPKQFPSAERIEELEAPMAEDNCQHGWFESTYQGKKGQKTYQLHYRYFLPTQDPPKAIAVFMHGLQNHSGCAYIIPSNGNRRNMAAISRELCIKRGFAVYAFDLLGHGYSEGPRHVMHSADVQIDDYKKFVEMVASKHPPQTPLFLTGESLGGNLTLHVARYYQENPDSKPQGFQGMVLVAPAVYPHTIYLPAQLMMQTFNTVLPFAHGWRPPSIIPSPVGVNKIWRDPERIELGKEPNGIQALPSQHPPYLSLLTLTVLMRKVRDTTIPGMGSVPFCVCHGFKDVAIPRIGSEWLVEQALKAGLSEEDCTLKMYPDALHDLLSEPEAEEMMVFVADWMCQRIDQTNNKEPN